MVEFGTGVHQLHMCLGHHALAHCSVQSLPSDDKPPHEDAGWLATSALCHASLQAAANNTASRSISRSRRDKA